MNLYPFFHLYFLNSDISVTICAIKIKFSMRLPKVIIEGNVSQIVKKGPNRVTV